MEISETESRSFFNNFGGPSRFDISENESSTYGFFSSFDDITYNTKPIVQADSEKNYASYLNQSNHSTGNLRNTCMEVVNNSSLRNGNIKNDGLNSKWIEFDPKFSYNFELNKKHKVFSSFNREFQLKKKKKKKNFFSEDFIDGHANIVREILKKYPYLIRQNKNIRLKILQKESSCMEFPSSEKHKISYIVLNPQSVLSNSVETINQFKNVCEEYVAMSNQYGPWKCVKCDLNEQYDDYHMFRRHMQDVHSAKFDPRICEYCGFKTFKRNSLMYHMYIKHNILPPKSLTFPKCQVCPYIALSKSFLLKHQTNHKHYSSNSSSFQQINTNSVGILGQKQVNNKSSCKKTFKVSKNPFEYEIKNHIKSYYNGRSLNLNICHNKRSSNLLNTKNKKITSEFLKQLNSSLKVRISKKDVIKKHISNTKNDSTVKIDSKKIFQEEDMLQNGIQSKNQDTLLIINNKNLQKYSEKNLIKTLKEYDQGAITNAQKSKNSKSSENEISCLNLKKKNELVKELENITTEKVQLQVSKDKKFLDLQKLYAIENNFVKKSNNDSDLSLHATENAVYIEEETEILEYETYINDLT